MGMSFDIKLDPSTVKLIPSGYRAVLKSEGVQELLGKQAEAAATRCNDLFSLHRVPDGAHYKAEVVMRGYTAGGMVRVADKYGWYDNLINNTLKKGCNV